MSEKNDIWNAHARKAEQALIEARFLFGAGMHDGASTLALGSCIQMSRALASRLAEKDDPEEWLQTIRKMGKDGRLPERFVNNLFEIIKANNQQISSAHPCDEKRSAECLELADTFQRMTMPMAELSISMHSPKVKKALIERGMPTGFTF